MVMLLQYPEKSGLTKVTISLMKILGVVFVCTLLGTATARFDNESATMIYLVGIIYIAMTSALWKSLLASVLSVFAFNFFIVPPYFSLHDDNPHYFFTYVFMLVLSFFASYLFNRHAHAQALLSHQSELINLTSDAIIEWGAVDKRIKFWNKGAEAMFAVPAQIACGQKISDVLNFPENLNDDVIANIRKNGFFNCDRTYSRPGGVSLSVSSRWAYKEGTSKSEGSIIEFSTDISEKKKAEKRVKEFYSTVSHELRTPLTSIKAALGLLENQVVIADSENGKKLIVLARNQSDHLHNLINDILDLQKIESGHFKLNKDTVELSKIISNVIHELTLTAEAAHVSMIQDRAIPENCVVQADIGKIEQVLTNLVGNAIKFSNPNGEIRINAERKGKRVRVSVADKGPGIPDDQMHKLFGKFQQLDQTDTRMHGGTGLGLAISKAIIEQHNGAIGVDSSLGSGSTFWFELDAYDEALA